MSISLTLPKIHVRKFLSSIFFAGIAVCRECCSLLPYFHICKTLEGVYASVLEKKYLILCRTALFQEFFRITAIDFIFISGAIDSHKYKWVNSLFRTPKNELRTSDWHICNGNLYNFVIHVRLFAVTYCIFILYINKICGAKKTFLPCNQNRKYFQLSIYFSHNYYACFCWKIRTRRYLFSAHFVLKSLPCQINK